MEPFVFWNFGKLMSDYFSESLPEMPALRLVHSLIFQINCSNSQYVHKVGYMMLCVKVLLLK